MSIAIDDIEALEEAAIERLEGRYEYFKGRYVEKPPMGAESNLVVLELMSRLWPYVKSRRLGLCFVENAGYRIFADDPKRRRIPDGSFVRSGKLVDNKPPRGDLRVPPDLAVEVVSPNDLAEDLQARINDLMGAGVLILWVIYPESRQAYIHRADGTVTLVGGGDDLAGEDVVPGFTIKLAELFDAV